MRELILASSSSRRQYLMDQLNLEYRVCVSNIDESIFAGELPEEYVSRMACTKAEVVSRLIANESSVNKLSANESFRHQIILAADTIIAMDGKILGKPKDAQDAKETLVKLSDAKHDVLTALYLKTDKVDYKSLVRSGVKFKLLENIELEAYCSTTEPYDKAGAYAIQGAGASFVEYLSGSYTNVVGLPVQAVCELLKKCKFL